ncbi:MAG TPA: hypothetical protein VGF99_02320 [Myxococcota bacterium]
MKLKTLLLAMLVAVPALAAGAHVVSDACGCPDCDCAGACDC